MELSTVIMAGPVPPIHVFPFDEIALGHARYSFDLHLIRIVQGFRAGVRDSDQSVTMGNCANALISRTYLPDR
jgi:hypothetical protein